MTKRTMLVFDWGDTLMKEFLDEQGPMCDWAKVELVDGVEEALRELSEKFMLTLASNANESNAALMGQALARVHVRHYFDFLFTSHELGYKKPDARFFQEISVRTNFPIASMVMIGNDPVKDIEGAKKARLKTILFHEASIPLDCEHADQIICSMKLLTDAVEKIVNL